MNNCGISPLGCLRLAFAAGGLVLACGCAVHYCDKATGTEHLWGFGHIRMKAEPSTNTLRAIVKGTQLFGLNVGVGREECYLSAGWDNRRRIIVMDNASVSLEWPNNSFFNVRVGTAAPFATNLSPRKDKPSP